MKSILIVEDVELNRDLLVQLLEDTYRLLIAEDGAAALEVSAAERPDLILMDLSLPKLDGWEATRRLKADPALAAIPVIALSAHAMKSHEDRAWQNGCDDYLTKPLDEDLLFETIDRHLARAAAAAIRDASAIENVASPVAADRSIRSGDADDGR